MNKPIIEIENLTKVYDKTTVVNKFNMSVEKGHIYGIIGPNGAGKTTFFRMLAGLTEPTSGSISFFGEKDNLSAHRKRMSFMIEAPYLDVNMTSRENLIVLRYVRGVANESKIDQVLKLVGLENTGKKIVKNFSLGMRQRLGIAMALLSDPEIMVLDEPVNGLDPEGIVEIRHLLKKLAEEEGVTILISSHLLTELSQLSTDFALISNGTLIETFTTEELDTKCRSHIAIKTDNINQTVAILEEKLNSKLYKVVIGDELHIYEQLDNLSKVSKIITEAGQTILKLNIEGESLEEYYLEKVGGTHE